MRRNKDDVKITIWMTKPEWEMLHKRMDACGIQNMSAYIRRTSLQGILVNLKGITELIELLRDISNTINGLSEKKMTDSELKYLSDSLSRIELSVYGITEKLNQINKSEDLQNGNHKNHSHS